MYFPSEILSAILSYQPKPDLKKARLVCKAFDATAVPFLFNEVFVSARYADMEKASLLTSHFGRFVKTLIFCTEHFEPNISQKAFENAIADTTMGRNSLRFLL